MSRPICVECRVEYSCDKNEVLVNDPVVEQFPATYWYGDRWKCPGCGHLVIAGRGKAIWRSSSEITQLGDSFEFNHNLPAEKLEVKNE